MKIMSYLTGTAIALAVSVGSASAADRFATLVGVRAEPLAASEMATLAVGKSHPVVFGDAIVITLRQKLFNTGNPALEGLAVAGPLNRAQSAVHFSLDLRAATATGGRPNTTDRPPPTIEKF